MIFLNCMSIIVIVIFVFCFVCLFVRFGILGFFFFFLLFNLFNDCCINLNHKISQKDNIYNLFGTCIDFVSLNVQG